MNNSVQIGRILGVPLRIHWTAPLLVILLGYTLGRHTLPASVPGQSTMVYSLAGVAGSLLLLGSLLAHELAHAITARRKCLALDVPSASLSVLRPMGVGIGTACTTCNAVPIRDA
ncbi:putative zinc metalloprotease Rip3 [Streptomyces jeddahensis]|uniref:Putative zinc metalloprotease Rip3 n=1 Tax=Streptomyces jeddahensis TaxID=1716141 RepID=A0A177HGZ1_9ACTN|nr:putative zinc metalloprotease Rip3 [Streptomyces jeddahensis]